MYGQLSACGRGVWAFQFTKLPHLIAAVPPPGSRMPNTILPTTIFQPERTVCRSPMQYDSAVVARQLSSPLLHGRSTSPLQQRGPHPPQAMPRLKQIAGGMRTLHYTPAHGEAKGLVILAPGGMGGMGPGVPPASHDFFSPSVPSVYSVLARRLAEDHHFAVMHFTWKIPSKATPNKVVGGAVRTPRRVRECADDVAAVARALRVAHGGVLGKLPLVLIGFSSEACAAVMAAASLSLAHADVAKGVDPVAGVICLAPGLRTNGHQHDYGGCDTLSCLEALASAHVPLLLMHGLDDTAIEPESTALTFEAATGPKTACFVQHADHGMGARFDDVLTRLLVWVPALFRRFDVVGNAAGEVRVPELDDALGLGRVDTL